MIELKPCECGETFIIPVGTDLVGWKVICSNCPKETYVYATEKEAIEAWNRRVEK